MRTSAVDEATEIPDLLDQVLAELLDDLGLADFWPKHSGVTKAKAALQTHIDAECKRARLLLVDKLETRKLPVEYVDDEPATDADDANDVFNDALDIAIVLVKGGLLSPTAESEVS